MEIIKHRRCSNKQTNKITFVRHGRPHCKLNLEQLSAVSSFFSFWIAWLMHP